MSTNAALPELYFPPAIDSTMLSMFACPQKWFNEFCLRQVPVGRSIHLHAGGCMAEAFDNVRKYFYGPEHCTLEEALFRAFRVYTKSWGSFDPPPIKKRQYSYKDFTNCWMAIESYFQHYNPSSDFFQPVMKADGYPATEFRFGVPTGIAHPDTGDEILFAGRADMLATSDSGAVWVVDEKSTASIGESWGEQWDMRGQFFGYTFAARYMGYNAVGTLVRGIAIQQTQFGFAERPLLYQDDELMRWWRHTRNKIARMVYHYQVSREIMESKAYGDNTEARLKELYNAWPMDFGDNCENYGGCVFRGICNKADPWNYVENFERRIWNPLAYDPAAESENRQAEMEEVSFTEAGGW